MDTDESKNVEARVRNIMDAAKPRRPTAPPKLTQIEVRERVLDILDSAEIAERPQLRRGRHFALGLFLTAIFLVVLAAILPAEDRLFWGGCGGLLLLVAAWQWDKARPKSE